ncbi:MAG TPA: tRNA (adenosine(37)-N6)-dimethylallyltransferase MiaA [Longimicrobiales bacterium]
MASAALAIVGATATGKTDLAIAVAQRLTGEVVSMDSRQVYRGMDIGTAKPTPAERRGVPHHGFDLVDPDERFNAGRFAALARGWIEQIRARGHVPILAGGTGFFLRALTYPMFDEPPLDAARKESWKRYLAQLSGEEITRWARELDPVATARTHDRQRLARVIEIAVLTGRPLSWWHGRTENVPPAIDPVVFVLDLPRTVLYRRIEARVERMLDAGLVREVRGLMEGGYDERAPGMNATGYIELVPFIRGERTLDEAIELIRSATRRYARRQLTWLRHQLPAGAIRLDAQVPAAALADTVARVWHERNT